MIVGETPIDTEPGDETPGSSTSTSDPTQRVCVRVTGGVNHVDTGDTATDALFLSGELFICANDVVVVGTDDLNEVAAAAQLAAALGGPLLYSHAQVPSELGRLKPLRIHVVGIEEDIHAPPDAEVRKHAIPDAVEAAREALGVTEVVRVPSVPEASTIVETVLAIRAADRVVMPEAAVTSTTASNTPVDPIAVIQGLGVQSGADSAWIVDATDPMTVLLAAASGQAVNAAPVPVDTSDLLGHPEVADALAGIEADSVRYVGSVPEGDDWELAVLSNGVQVPGGGFYILPKESPRRYVAFYGHPETSALGALGEQGPIATLERMGPFLQAYGGDGSQVVPTFEMIASVAAAQATDDNDYSFEWPVEAFEEWIRVAEESEAYVIFDLQSGRDDFLTQAKMYQELLELPFVGLALDPEWRLGPDQVHLRQVGKVEAAEVNQVIHWLADLVRDKGLPQKMLIVHQFRTFMIQNREMLEQRPELQLIIQMDGDGTEPQKDSTYAALNQGAENAFWSWGWKNFFDEDEPGPPTAESTMGKNPVPVYVSYQ